MILGALLDSLGINDDKIIYGILNVIPSPSSLWYVVKKYHETTFMSIEGVFFAIIPAACHTTR